MPKQNIVLSSLFYEKELAGKVWVLWTCDQQFLENQRTGFHSTIDLKKPKELVKEPSPQSFGFFTSSSIKPIKFFEIFQKPKLGIYFRNLSKTLKRRFFDSKFFQKTKTVVKKRNQINNYFILVLSCLYMASYMMAGYRHDHHAF